MAIIHHILTLTNIISLNKVCPRHPWRCHLIRFCLLITFLSSALVGRAIVSKTDIKLIDSIRNRNTVYNEEQAASVLPLFKRLKGTIPDDSLRQYVTEGLLGYNWFLVNEREWFICRRLLETADRLCPVNNESLRQQLAVAKAGIYLYNKQYGKAGPILEEACNYFKQQRDTVEYLKMCVNLGLFYTRTHNKPKALEYYGKVLKIADSKKYENYYSIVTGYAEKIEEDSIIGLSTFKKALDISLSNGYTFLLASNYNNLAKYHYRLENYREAILNARNALKYSELFNDNSSRLIAMGILADIYYIKRDYVSAYTMEKEINKLTASMYTNQDTRIYEHLAYTDSLISWVEENVPEAPSNLDHTIPFTNRNRLPRGLAIALIAVMLTVTAIIFMYTRSKSGRDDEEFDQRTIPEETPPQTTTQVLPEIPQPAVTPDALGLKLIATGYNSLLDRVRSAVKDIPKTGNVAADTKMRALYTYLLQARLPELSGELVEKVTAEEDNFINRLCKAYPAITRSDQRLALYIRAGLSLQEISSLTGLQTKSVNQARYRLRKSLGLLPNDSLEAFIMAF